MSQHQNDGRPPSAGAATAEPAGSAPLDGAPISFFDMVLGGDSLLALVVSLVASAFFVVPLWIILKRAGFSPWLSLLALTGIGGLIVEILLAVLAWPALAVQPAKRARRVIGLMFLIPISVVIPLVPVLFWMPARILRKAGYSGWWVITLLIPIVGFFMVWVFAFVRWPALSAAGSYQPARLATAPAATASETPAPKRARRRTGDANAAKPAYRYAKDGPAARLAAAVFGAGAIVVPESGDMNPRQKA